VTAADLPAGPELDRRVATALDVAGKWEPYPYSQVLGVGTYDMTRWLTADGAELGSKILTGDVYVDWESTALHVITAEGDTLPLALSRLVVRVAEWRAGR